MIPEKHRPALFRAVERGWVEEVEPLLQGGSDPNMRWSGVVPLMLAMRADRLPIVELLLEYGADPNAKDDKGNSVLGYLYRVPGLQGSAIEERLRKAGVREDDSVAGQLLGAASSGDCDVVSELLARGANPDVAGPWNDRALQCAAGCGRADIVRLLLNRGAKVNYRHENRGWTALIAAAQRGYVEIVRMLIEAGADPLIPFEDDMPQVTARLYAMENRHLEVAKYLQEQEKTWKRPSPYAKAVGLQNAEQDAIAIMVKSSTQRVVAALAAIGSLPDHHQDVLGQEAVLRRRSYLLLQLKGHSWCALYPMTPSTVDDSLRDWAKELSSRLATKSLYYEHDEDAGSIYSVFESGREIQKMPEGVGRADTAEVEKAVSKFLKKERTYLHHMDPYRMGTGKHDVLVADLSPRDVEAFDVLCSD
jgi:ankyrin repeat protein